MTHGGNGDETPRRKRWICALGIIAGLGLAFLVGRAALNDLAAVERARGLNGPAPQTAGN